jgi:5-methylcytosine-specific restriction endonuclease McrA
MDGSLSNADELPIEELEEQITELAGHLNAAHYRWLLLIREFDRRVGWGDGKLASCAHWLNFKCGINLGAAREKVRVAHALSSLPLISASMARGELSYSKVRALTRVASRATEKDLLNIALHGTAHHVEKTVRLFRQAMQAQELSHEGSQQANRTLSYHYEEDGSLVLKARVPALGGALVVKALEAAMAQLPDTEEVIRTSETVSLSYGARRADALVRMAESSLKHKGSHSTTADHYQVVVHVDAETLRAGAPGRSHVEHGPTLPVQTIRRIGCDASLVAMLESPEGKVLNVGRKTRSIPPAIRRALAARDPGCQFPGCTFTKFLDAHHIEHWADGGETKLTNLVTLCRWHHRLLHEGEIRVKARSEGGWQFSTPDGKEFQPVHADATIEYEGTELETEHRAQDLSITATTAATRWRGERMDYDLAVFLLCDKAERERDAHADSAPDVSAETLKPVPARNADNADDHRGHTF